MNVLVACEFSGRVRDAFSRLGHYAVSCDVLPSESPGEHYQGCALDVIGDGWDLVIAHPPCTRLANSGVRWLHERSLWAELDAAASFFRHLLLAPVPRLCVENPIPHRYALERIGRRYDQVIQPWQFGHGETKATCLWLRGLPPLVPSHVVDGRAASVHRCPPSPDRWAVRSRTFPGVAAAMAAQWGS